jgi:hypothetical protein
MKARERYYSKNIATKETIEGFVMAMEQSPYKLHRRRIAELIKQAGGLIEHSRNRQCSGNPDQDYPE